MQPTMGGASPHERVPCASGSLSPGGMRRMVEHTRQEFSFVWRGLTLAGTLHLPAAPPPHPAVLMLQGSGPADRDAGDYFPPIRDAFLARGIAAYSFDK